MTFSYTPRGVCSNKMVFDVEDGVIRSVKVYGGCDGNLKGISSLLAGMSVDDAVARLSGIRCGMKATSCPDQMARALSAWHADHA